MTALLDKSQSTSKNKHISEPDDYGFQVRIVRRGQVYSRYFSHKMWGGKSKSLATAITWRDQTLLSLQGCKTRFVKPPKNKLSTGVTGVSKTIKHDANLNKSYLCYSVFWKKDDNSCVKSFQAGNIDTVTADDELHAFRTAKLFRYCYEFAIDNQLEFHDGRFAGWKKTRMYEDNSFNAVGSDKLKAPQIDLNAIGKTNDDEFTGQEDDDLTCFAMA